MIMDYPFEIEYGDGFYKVFTQVGTSKFGAYVHRALNVPQSAHKMFVDNTKKSSYRLLKILPQATTSNIKEYDSLTDDYFLETHQTHPNVLAIDTSFLLDKNSYCVVMEDVEGSLRHLMNVYPVFKNGLSENLIAVILKNVLNGLTFIHEIGLVHEQLESSSVFFNTKSSDMIKLGFGATNFDYGLLCKKDKRTTGYCKSLKKANPPEHGHIDPQDSELMAKTDIWMFGLFAAELAFGKIEGKIEPFLNGFRAPKQIAPAQILFPPNKKLMNMKFPNLQVSGKLKKSQTCLKVNGKLLSADFVDMVVQCTRTNPDERPNTEKLLQHRFLQCCSTNLKDFRQAVEEARELEASALQD